MLDKFCESVLMDLESLLVPQKCKKKKKQRKKQNKTKTKQTKKNKKKITRGQHSAILTEEDWSIKDLLHAQNKFFSCKPRHYKNTDGPTRVLHKES